MIRKIKKANSWCRSSFFLPEGSSSKPAGLVRKIVRRSTALRPFTWKSQKITLQTFAENAARYRNSCAKNPKIHGPQETRWFFGTGYSRKNPDMVAFQALIRSRIKMWETQNKCGHSPFVNPSMDPWQNRVMILSHHQWKTGNELWLTITCWGDWLSTGSTISHCCWLLSTSTNCCYAVSLIINQNFRKINQPLSSEWLDIDWPLMTQWPRIDSSISLPSTVRKIDHFHDENRPRSMVDPYHDEIIH